MFILEFQTQHKQKTSKYSSSVVAIKIGTEWIWINHHRQSIKIKTSKAYCSKLTFSIPLVYAESILLLPIKRSWKFCFSLFKWFEEFQIALFNSFFCFSTRLITRSSRICFFICLSKWSVSSTIKTFNFDSPGIWN
jgi:hypothetical protein